MSEFADYVIIGLLVAEATLTLRALSKHHDQVMEKLGEKRERGGEDGDGDVAPRD